MGVHFGRPSASKDRLTGRTEFSGPVVQHAATITSIAHGGQVPLASCMFLICLVVSFGLPLLSLDCVIASGI